MKIPLIDRGNYYRGLLVLIRKDRVISNRERELIIRLGQGLDFDKRFCESAINDLMINPHIKRQVIQFSDKKTAESFLHDAVALAFADGELHPKERSWLKTVASANGIKNDRVDAEIRSLKAHKIRKEPIAVKAATP